MTSRERFLALVNGEEVDRLPVEIHFVDAAVAKYFADHYNMTVDEFFDYLENDVRYMYSMDEVGCYIQDTHLLEKSIEYGFARKDPNHEAGYYDGFGISWDASKTGQRPLTHGYDWDVLENFQMPDPNREGMFYDYDRHIQAYKEKDVAFGVLQYYGPLEKLENIRGFEGTMIDFYEEPELMEELLRKVTDYRVALAEEICKRGVTFGHGGDDYGSQHGPMISLSTFREFIKPCLKKIYGVYRDYGLPILHHSCGNCSAFFDDLKEVGVTLLHPIQASAMDIHQLHEDHGDTLVYYGGFDTEALERITPSEVVAMVKDTIDTLSKNNRMCCAAINITAQVPFENFDAMMDAIKEYRYIHR